MMEHELDYNREIRERVEEAAEEAREKIIAGEIVVPDTYEGVEK